MNGFEKVLVIMGLFAFAKQAPKLIGDVIGVDSSNLKLGIGGKLAAGGAFGAAAVAGGALTTGLRNFVHGLGKSSESWNKFKATKGQGFGARAKAFSSALAYSAWHGVGGVSSGVAGGFSAGVRAVGNGAFSEKAPKNFADTRRAAGESARQATQARDHRESYRATHGGRLGAMVGHVSDRAHSALDWVGGGFEAEEAEIKYANQVLDQNNKLKSATEDLRKKNGDNAALLKGLQVKFAADLTTDVGRAEQARYEALFSQFKDMNLNSIRAYIDQQKSSTISRANFTNASGVFDEDGFNHAIREKAKREAELEKMLKDVEKAADMRIQTAAFNGATATAIGIDADKLSDVRNNMNQINDLLSSRGRTTVNTNMTVVNQNEIGNALRSIVTNLEVERNNNAAQVERKKRAREQRQGNRNNNSN